MKEQSKRFTAVLFSILMLLSMLAGGVTIESATAANMSSDDIAGEETTANSESITTSDLLDSELTQSTTISPDSQSFVPGATYPLLISTTVDSSSFLSKDSVTDPSIDVTVSDNIKIQSILPTDYSDSSYSATTATISSDVSFEPETSHTAVVLVRIPENAEDSFTVRATPGDSDSEGESKINTYELTTQGSSLSSFADAAKSRENLVTAYQTRYSVLLDNEPWEENFEGSMREAFSTAIVEGTKGAAIGSTPVIGTIDDFQTSYGVSTGQYGGGAAGQIAQINEQLAADLDSQIANDEIKRAGNSSKPLTELAELYAAEQAAWKRGDRDQLEEILQRQQAVLFSGFLNLNSNAETPYANAYDTSLYFEAREQADASRTTTVPDAGVYSAQYFDALETYALDEYDETSKRLELVRDPSPQVTTNTDHSTIESELKSLDPGQTKTILFSVKNGEAAVTGEQSYFSLSHNENLSVIDVSEVGTDESPTVDTTNASEEAFSKNGSTTLQYDLVDVISQYDTGQEREYRVTIERESKGEMWISYRAAFEPFLSEDGLNATEEQDRFSRYPQSGPTDQQGWPVHNLSTSDVPQPPRPAIDISAEPTTADPVTLDAGPTTADIQIDSYDWNIDTTGDGDFDETRTGETSSVDFNSGGVKQVQLTVTDSNGQTSSVMTQIEVTDNSAAINNPRIDFIVRPTFAEPGDTLRATASDAINGPEWSLSRDGSEVDSAAGESFTPTVDTGGLYEVTLSGIVDGQQVEKTKQVTVISREQRVSSPSVRVSLPSQVDTGETIEIDASESVHPHPDRQIDRFKLLVDGNTVANQSDGVFTQSFETTGERVFEIVVIGSTGNTSSYSETVSIGGDFGDSPPDDGDDQSPGDGDTSPPDRGFVDVDPSDLPGSGTEADPYLISNASELQSMEDDLDANYELVSDINASNAAQWNNGSGFDPVGEVFIGEFDGQHYSISHLEINRTNQDIGLFANVGRSATVINVHMMDLSITGSNNEFGTLYNVGGVAGGNGGTIRNVTVNGSVTGSSAGILVGNNFAGVIQNGSANGRVDGAAHAGGAVGISGGGTLVQRVSADVNVTGIDEVGGLVGSNQGQIQKGIASGSIDGNEDVGGIAGTNLFGGTIQNVSTDVSVNGSYRIGGLAGRNGDKGIIIDSIATGTVTGNKRLVGGLVGQGTGTVNRLYWDKQATEQTNPFGFGSSSGVTGLSTAQMTGEAAQTNMNGLPFDTVWETKQNDYPTVADSLNSDNEREEDDNSKPTPPVNKSDPTVNKTASSVSPTTVTAGKSETYNVTIVIENTSLNSSDSGEVGVRFDKFNFVDENSQTPIEDLQIDFTTANISGGIIRVTETVSGTAPQTTGSNSVNVTSVKVNNTGGSDEFLIDDASMSIGTINVVEASSNDIVVDPDPTVGEFNTIQAAVSNATDGDTIEVRSGTYSEQVTIGTNLTVTASEGVQINYNGTVGVGSAVEITDGAAPTIEGLTVTAPNSSGINTAGAGTGWALQDVTVKHTDFAAVRVGADGIIEDSRIQDADVGVTRISSAAWTLKNTTIERSGTAIRALSSDSDWRLQNVTVSESDLGVNAINSESDWTIHNSTFESLTGDGVLAMGSTGEWKIHNSQIRDTSRGINAQDSTGDWDVAASQFTEVLTGIDAARSTGQWTVRKTTIESKSTAEGVEDTAPSDGTAVYAADTTGAWKINQSTLVDNQVGVNAIGADATRNATYNYWGVSDGPSGDFNGSGAEAIGNVGISPFYVDADLTTLSTEPRTGAIKIDYDPSVGSATKTAPDPVFVAEKLTIAPESDGTSITVGGDSAVTFQITKPSTGQTVSIDPQSGDPAVAADSIGFDIYSGDGTIKSSPAIVANSTRINASVSGDTGMLAEGVADDENDSSAPFDEYAVRLLRDGDVVDATEPRVVGIGYSVGDGIEQTGKTGEIQFSVPRERLNVGVDSEWVARFSLGDDIAFEPVDVENNAGAEAFNFTVDVSDMPPGEYTYRLELYNRDEIPDRGGFDDRVITIYGVDAVDVDAADVTDPEVSIEHNPGSATASTPTGDGRAYADQLDIFVNTDDPVAFGGQGDLHLRVIDPETGNAVTYTPTSNARTVPLGEMYRLGIQNDGTGEPQEEILLFPESDSDLSFADINATVEGDTGIYTNETFNEYVIKLVDDDGNIIDSTDTRLVGMGYKASFEQDGETALVTRDPAVDPGWTAEFALVGDNSSIPPSEQVIDTVEVNHTEGDEHFEIPLGELDADPGEYSWTLTIVDESRAELDRERIVRISGDPQLDTGVTIRDGFGQTDPQPDVTLQSPRPASQTTPTAFDVTAEQQEPETVTLEVLDSEGTVVFEESADDEFENGTFATWDSTNQDGDVVADGEYDVVVTVEDQAGTEVTAEETVPVDNTAPAIENLEIVKPAGGETNDQITVRGDISEKGTNVQFAQAAIIAESTSYTKTKDFENADAVKTALEDGTLKVTFDATAISDEVGDGDFSIGMAAVDEAGNDALVEGDSFTIDTSPPSIQPGVSGLAEDTAVLTVEAEEDVTITNLDIEAVSSESESTADRTPASYDTDITPDDPATIEFDGGTLNNEDTSFTIDIEAEDAAGNTDTYTLTSSISSYRIEADGTAEVDPSAVNSSFVLTTDAESSANTEREATVVQSTSAPAGTDLADNQIADEFIDVSDIGLTEAELEEADVKIPLSEIDIEGIDDDELTMLYSPDGESDYETIQPDIVEEDGQEYLVATVDGFSQLAPAGVDDEPPTIESSSVDPGTNIDLADDDDSATVTFDYEDALSEIDTTATSVDVSGVDSERVSTQITKSTTEVDVTGLEDGESIGIDITVVDEGGNEANENVSLFIDDSSAGNEEDTDGGDGNTGGGDGSTGGGTNSDTSGTTSNDTDDTDDTVDTDDTDNTDNGSTDESTDDSMDDSTGDDSSDGGTTDESSSDDGVPGGATSDDETSEDSTPGFGAIMALVALIAAALAATRGSR